MTMGQARTIILAYVIGAANRRRCRREDRKAAGAHVCAMFESHEHNCPGFTCRVAAELAHREKFEAERKEALKSGGPPPRDQRVESFLGSDDYRFLLLAVDASVPRPPRRRPGLSGGKTRRGPPPGPPAGRTQMTSGSPDAEPTWPGPTPYVAAARKDSQEALRRDIVAAIITMDVEYLILYYKIVIVGKSQADVARDLGLKRQRVFEALTRLLDRLAPLLEKQRLEYGLKRRGSDPAPSGGE
jgi:hypothetical protein